MMLPILSPDVRRLWKMKDMLKGEVAEVFHLRVIGKREKEGFEKIRSREVNTERLCGISENGQILFQHNKVPYPLSLKLEGTWWYRRDPKNFTREYFVEPTLSFRIKRMASRLRNSFMERWNNKFGGK